MPDPLKFSRWRRLTGAHRILEQKLPTHRVEPQRLTLFLPGAVLDGAERLAARAGLRSVQAYCEALLTDAIARETVHQRLRPGDVAIDALARVEEIAQDAETLEEWSTISTIVVEADGPIEPTGGAEPGEPGR